MLLLSSSLRAIKLPAFVIVTTTIVFAFLFAFICSLFFDSHQLKENTDLISSVYQVMGTIYAILLTFTLWGTWQNFTEAGIAVQREAYALLDLVHTLESANDWKNLNIRNAALQYTNLVINDEWPTLPHITSCAINLSEKTHSASLDIVKDVQSINPANDREIVLMNQSFTLLNQWLDARRSRLLMARGNSAKALWPLLITGACVLFAFHGLFVAKTVLIWVTLLFGNALVIGLTFYLIFTLDCPFSGSLSIDAEPFIYANNILRYVNK